MSATRRLSLTLAIMKPDLMARPKDAESVRRRIVEAGFFVLRSRILQFSLPEARAFYSEHSGKEFFNRLTQSMCKGLINPLVLAHSNAIQSWRQLMGPTKRASVLAPDSIRGHHTTTETKNAVHGADSEEKVIREIKWFFPDFDFKMWELEEPLYRANAVYDEEKGIHCLQS